MRLLPFFLLWLLPFCGALSFWDAGNWKNLPLKSLHVQGEFFDSLGEVIIRQIWVNQENSPITSKYKFPLDSNAVVSGFQMKIGNLTWSGVVKAKDTARSEFDNAVASGIKSSILEKISDNEYEVEIGPIPSSQTAEIEFHYLTHVAVQLDGSYRFVLPTNIARKYSPTRSTNFADQELASRMASTPYMSQPPYTFGVDLNWHTGSALRGVVSPTNEIHTELLSATAVRVRCTTAPENGDFSLLVTTASTTGAYSYQNDEGTTYLYVHNQIPSEAMPSHRAKKITVVLDRSGSMYGQKMGEAVQAVDRFLSMLPFDEATFVNIVSFGNQYTALYSNAVPATTNNIQDMRARVREFKADFGGTELLDCLRAVIAGGPLPGSSHTPGMDHTDTDHVIVLLTDGQITNLHAVIDLLKNSPQSFRIMSVGIGRDADRKLVEQVADTTHGLSRMLIDETDLTRTLTDILAYIDKQYYTDVKVLDYEASQCSQVLYPAHPVDMFLRLSPSQYQQVATSGLTITAKDPVHRGSIKVWHLPVTETIKTGRLLEKLYADHTISQLSAQMEKMDRFANTHHDIAHMTESIVALSVKHGIMNKHTSFLVISDEKIDLSQQGKVLQGEVPQHEATTTGSNGGNFANVMGGTGGSFSAKRMMPARQPSSSPSLQPSRNPGVMPSVVPSGAPSMLPKVTPAILPSTEPSMLPKVTPAIYPSAGLSFSSDVLPTIGPSAVPSVFPTVSPTSCPSTAPSAVPTVVSTAAPTGSAGPSLNVWTVPTVDLLVEINADGSPVDESMIERIGVNTDPKFPDAPMRITGRVLAALQHPDGSLLYAPRSFMFLRFVNSVQLEEAAYAVGLKPALFFNAMMLLTFEVTRVGDEGETERLLLRKYVTTHVSANVLAQLEVSLIH